MPATPRPPDPARYQRVEALVRKGQPDRVIVRMVAQEFDCCENTIRNDLRRLWTELKQGDAEKREHRRDVLRYQLETLHAEVREVAEKAREGFPVMGPDGPIIIQDMKTAGMSLSTAEKLVARLVQVDGVAEVDKIKADLLRLKVLRDSGMTQEQLDALIAVEVKRAIEAMPVEELEQIVQQRRAG
jgi:hypothetical protein